MMLKKIAIATAFAACALTLAEPAKAQCREGTVQIGEREVQEGNVIWVHPVCHNAYIPVGNGLLAGTGWQLGVYVPEGASDEVVAHSRQIVRDAARVAGVAYDEQVDFERYNFVMGIGNSTEIWRDLATRVVWEQLANGQLTAYPGYQSVYNSLRDRQFDQLGCHSNGAMICLAALMNRDIEADDVVLYGPQVTPESLEMWNDLLSDHRIKSLRIIVAQNDPVTPAALLFSPGGLSLAQSVPLLYDVESLEGVLRTMAPEATVSSFQCGSSATYISSPFACHGLAGYSAFHRRCPTTAAGPDVPGTRNPGGRRVAEPPSPGCR